MRARRGSSTRVAAGGARSSTTPGAGSRRPSTTRRACSRPRSSTPPPTAPRRSAVNGHGTARSVARFYGGLAEGGELDSVKLLRSEIVDDALRPHARGYDELLEEEASWGLGFRVDDADTFGLGGIGGFAGFGIRRPISRWATATSRACSPATSGPRHAKTLSMRCSRR
jgi:Beta-lactamase